MVQLYMAVDYCGIELSHSHTAHAYIYIYIYRYTNRPNEIEYPNKVEWILGIEIYFCFLTLATSAPSSHSYADFQQT